MHPGEARRRDGYLNAVAPVWEGLRLIRNEVTNSAADLINVTW